ncbi:1-acylglycerol-3-phosphate O-acyltransferase [Aureococcus anophagefferens]|uniref:1-acyl-sn-glycerol-3-phosphate acyltransferase n=2 Tax=Aureococcus anophagefferens TaxID=44056 RepID=A0ABR1FW68_AURAN
MASLRAPLCALALALPAAIHALQIPQRGVARPRAAASRRFAGAVASPAPVPGAPQPGRFALKLGSKAMNPVGAIFGLSMSCWVIAMYPLVLTCAAISRVSDWKRRRAMDWMVGFWSRVSMLTCGYRPAVVGAEHLPDRDEAVLYVPNHCSYLDILTLSAFLPRPFKYISKIEILRIPFIGWAMGFAGHIALRRADRRSQLESYKAAVASLKDGNSLVAFAEGTRSDDGTLKKFKRGPFKMAIDAGVDIVPIALCDLHKWHPPSALMPLAVPKGVELKVLPRVKTRDRSADELMADVQAAVDAALPDHQKAASA